MIFGESVVIFRNRLSNLINDAYCDFFSPPHHPRKKHFPKSMAPFPGAHQSQGPVHTLHPGANRWLLSTVHISAQWPPIVGSSTMSNPIPHLFPNPIFLMSKDKLLHSENGNRWRELTLAAFPITKYHERNDIRDPTKGPQYPSILIWFTNLF